MHNFIAYFRNGGDFFKSYWAKWPRKQVAFSHGPTSLRANYVLFLKPLGQLDKVVFSRTQTTKAANSKAFTCKLRDNTTHSKGLITWAGEAMRMSSVLLTVLFLTWFICRAARQAWLLGKFPPGIPASLYWDPSQPGWLGCHVIAKLIFVAFKRSPATSSYPLLYIKWTSGPTHVLSIQYFQNKRKKILNKKLNNV